MTAKDEIVAMVKKMPDRASFAAISAKVQTIAAIREAQGQIAAGEGKPHSEVKDMFEKLSSKWKPK